MTGSEARVPSVFVSYSWDDEEHRGWVRNFATRLRNDGVDAKLDEWEVGFGDPLPEFMERAVRENDFVLVICTPKYKERSDGRVGGVGYEGGIMTAELFLRSNHRKFIPVLRRGGWSSAFPSWLSGKKGADLRGESYSEEQYARLVDTLHGQTPGAPPLGVRPTRGPRAAPPKPLPVDEEEDSVGPVDPTGAPEGPRARAEGRAAEPDGRVDLLPPPPELVLGRKDELRAAKRALGVSTAGTGPSSRDLAGTSSKKVVAVHGWPGVGKSTFVSALCNDGEVLDRFSDGVFFVAVGRSPDARRLAEEVCAALEVPAPPGATPGALRGRIANALSRRSVLIVFDDVWDERDVSPLLSTGGASAALVATRRLDVAAWLATSPEASLKLGLLSAEDSLELLRSRAPYVVAKNEEACRDLAGALDGLPLALRVAADLLRVESESGFDVTDLLAELADAGRVLGEWPPADVDPGTEGVTEEKALTTVRALLNKSLERLDGDFTRRFARLGVLPPKPLSFDPWAALDLWRDTAEDSDAEEDERERKQAQTRDALRELVRRGLVEPAGEGIHPLAVKLDLRSKRPERFWMHALVSAFALETLERTEGEGGVREAQQRRLEHYRRIAGAADGAMSIGGDTQYFGAYMVALDLPSIRAAYGWARSHSPGDRRATEYLSNLLWQGSRTLAERLGPEEFLEWTLLAEEAARSTEDREALKYHRANLGAALLRNDRPEEALPYFEESLAEARADEDASAEAAALANHAVVYGGRRDYETALDYARQAEEAGERADSPNVQVGAIGQQAEFLNALGRIPEAEERLETQRDLARQKGELSRYAKALRDLARIRRDRPAGRAAAREMYQEAAEVFWNLGEYANYRSAVNGLGILETEAGCLDAAEEAFRRALRSAVEDGDKGDQARAKMHLGIVHRHRETEQGFEAAETEFRKALPLASSSEDPDKLGDVLINLALLLRDGKGNPDGAREAAEQAVEAYASVGSEKEAWARQFLGELDGGRS